MLLLYRLYLADFRFFGHMKVKEFVVGEAQEAFAEFMVDQEDTLPRFMQEQL